MIAFQRRDVRLTNLQHFLQNLGYQKQTNSLNNFQRIALPMIGPKITIIVTKHFWRGYNSKRKTLLMNESQILESTPSVWFSNQMSEMRKNFLHCDQLIWC